MNIQELHKTIGVIMESNKKARQNNNYILLIENGFACLEYIHKIIDIAVESEKQYRQFEAKVLYDLKESGVKGKNGEAETRAKATGFYSDWQHSIQLITLCYEMVNVAKLLSRSLDKELKAMPNIHP